MLWNKLNAAAPETVATSPVIATCIYGQKPAAWATIYTSNSTYMTLRNTPPQTLYDLTRITKQEDVIIAGWQLKTDPSRMNYV